MSKLNTGKERFAEKYAMNLQCSPTNCLFYRNRVDYLIVLTGRERNPLLVRIFLPNYELLSSVYPTQVIKLSFIMIFF